MSSSNDELILRQTQDERRSDVQAAFARFRESDDVRLVMREDARFVTQPIIRGREIVMEEAVPDVGRFFDNVDLVALAGLAREHSRLPDLVDAYCRAHAPVPLPSVLGGLSLLVAKGILAQRV